jgi:hypothetical protein
VSIPFVRVVSQNNHGTFMRLSREQEVVPFLMKLILFVCAVVAIRGLQRTLKKRWNKVGSRTRGRFDVSV